MRRLTLGLITFSILFTVFSLPGVLSSVLAQTSSPQGSFEVEVGGRVSTQSANQVTTTTTVSISGFASPNASIVLLDASNNSIASVTADALGNFSITNLTLPLTSSQYCFRVVDFKRLGTSESCMTIDPRTQSTITNVYLPPTIGVERSEITQGQEAVIYGYTMPNAVVKLKLSTGETVTITADSTGYYEYKNNALEAGEYSFVASASYNSTDSLDPKTTAKLKALSPEEVAKKAKETIKKIGGKQGFPWWILSIPILLLIAGGAGAWYLSRNNDMRKRMLSLIPIALARLNRGKKLHHDKLLRQLEKETAQNSKNLNK